MKQGILYTARDFIAHCCVNASKHVRCEEKWNPAMRRAKGAHLRMTLRDGAPSPGAVR